MSSPPPHNQDAEFDRPAEAGQGDQTGAPIEGGGPGGRDESEDEVDVLVDATGTDGQVEEKDVPEAAEEGPSPTTEAEEERDAKDRPDDSSESAPPAPAIDVTDTEAADGTDVAAGETDDGKAPSTDAGADGAQMQISREPSPSLSPSPSPAPGAAASAKKFSAININKRFLGKTAAPVPVAAATTGGVQSKLLSLGSRGSASPVPIASSSRLQSSKLATISAHRTSTSPQPPVSSPSGPPSSPWARPAAPASSALEEKSHPGAGRRLGSGPPLAAMGVGAGIGGGTTRPAWRKVDNEGRREPGGGMGMSRDFPTAHEVAARKRAAELAAEAQAEAQAARQQDLVQSLNVFTQLGSDAHRWDDDDDDDDVIDFGDGSAVRVRELRERAAAAAALAEAEAEPEQAFDQPVSKKERFVEDFDRSWPGRRPETTAEARQLFNASSNKLEAAARERRQAAAMATASTSAGVAGEAPKLLTRQSGSAGDAGPRSVVLPSQGRDAAGDSASSPASWGGSRGQELPPRPAQPSIGSGSRQAWANQMQGPRQPPAAPAAQVGWPAPPPTSAAASASASADPQRGSAWRKPASALSPEKTTAALSTPAPAPGPGHGLHAMEQAAAPKPAAQAAQSPVAAATTPGGGEYQEQADEMHTAAERARLRRVAEEKEREAAAERAKRKAKELEERLGLKASAVDGMAPAATASTVQPAQATQGRGAPPGLGNKASPAAPQYTIAPRPRAEPDVPAGPTPGPAALTSPTAAASGPGQQVETRNWRERMAEARTTAAIAEASLPAKPSPAKPKPQIQEHVTVSLAAQTSLPAPAEPQAGAITLLKSPEKQVVPPKDTRLDSTLARIQAVLAQAKISAGAAGVAEVLEASMGADPLDLLPPAETAALVTTPATQAPTAEPPASVAAPQPALTLIPSFFDVSFPLPPPSPPPAWRTYTVKIPKAQRPRSPTHGSHVPVPSPADTVAWLMSLSPPIPDITAFNFSRSAFLLNSSTQARDGRRINAPPVVSIPTRTLQPAQRKGKKKQPSASISKSSSMPEVEVPLSEIESLLPSSTSVPASSASAQLRSQRKESSAVPSGLGRWSRDPSTARASPLDAAASSAASTSTTTAREPPPRRLSPVKVSAAQRAEREGVFSADGVGTVLPERGRAMSDAKDGRPGVRFMVSSELEGESLLDEVNKMSLETVGEGEMAHMVDGAGTAAARASGSGSDTPKTPPALASAPRTLPSSPNGIKSNNATPWSGKSNVSRSSSQHDHLKSVWEPTATDPVKRAALASNANVDTYGPSLPVSAPGPTSGVVSAPLTAVTSREHGVPAAVAPVFPSLNGPSPSELSSAASKLGFAGTPSPSAYVTRGLPSQSSAFGHAQESPDSPIGMPYSTLQSAGRGVTGALANGWSSVGQQQIWSAPGLAFSSSEGYTGKGAPDAARAYVSASNPYLTSGGLYTGGGSAYAGQAAYAVSQGYSMTPYDRQRLVSAASGAPYTMYGYPDHAGRGAGANAGVNVNVNVGRNKAARYGSAAGAAMNGASDDYVSPPIAHATLDAGAYYGALGQHQQQQQQHLHQLQQQQHHGHGHGQAQYGYRGHGAIGRQQHHHQQQQQQQQEGGQGMGARTMWQA